MKTKLQELLKLQQRRIDKMRLQRIRVKMVPRGQFYVTIKITNEEILIKPDLRNDDNLNLLIALCAYNLNGFHEIEPHGIKLIVRGLPAIKIYFRTKKQQIRALKRIRELTGSESIPDLSKASGSSSSAINKS